MRSIDGVARRPPANMPLQPARPATMQAPRPTAPPPQNQAATSPKPAPTRRTFTAPPTAARRRHWWQTLVLPVCVFAGILAGFMMQSLVFGLIAVTCYALIAWVRRLPSRITFVLAFLALLTVVVLLTIRPNVALASNFATYTFALLVVGIVSAVLESRAAPKHKRGKIHR